MSESSSVPNIFQVPVMQNITLHQTYDRDVLMHPSEECNRRRHRDSLVVTPPPAFLCSNILSGTQHDLMSDAFAGWVLM